MEKNHIKKIIETLNIFNKNVCDSLSKIAFGLKKARQLRISSIANALQGNPESNQKSITRTLDKLSRDQLLDSLLAFADSKDKLALLDFTDMPRENAKKTEYVGYLKDGETRGYGVLALGMPFKGRTKVIFADVMSSATIAQDCISKWKFIQDSLHQVIPFLQSKVIVADREFSNEEMINFFVKSKIDYAIRLKLSAGRYKVRITNRRGKDVDLYVQKGRKKCWKNVYYKGNVKVNIAVEWSINSSEPMYIITNCEPKKGLKYYKIRMKIEESFKDVKDKLGFTKLMNKKRSNLLKLLLIGFLTYNILLLVGEQVRTTVLTKEKARKYSGLHILFNMVGQYTRSVLKKAFRDIELYLHQINSDNSIWLRAFRRC